MPFSTHSAVSDALQMNEYQPAVLDQYNDTKIILSCQLVKTKFNVYVCSSFLQQNLQQVECLCLKL